MLNSIRRIRDRLGPLWWHSGLLFVCSRFGDLIGLYIGVILVPEYIAQEKLGAVLPVTSLAAFVAVPLSVLVNTSRKYLNVFHVKEEHGKVKAMLRDLVLIVSALSMVLALYIWRQWDFVKERLKLEDPRIALLVAGIAIVSCWRPLATMVATSLKQFYRLIVSRLLSPIFRLAVILIALRPLQLVGYLLASLVSMVVGVVALGSGLKRYVHVEMRRESYREHLPDMARYMVPVAIIGLSLSLQGLIEPWVVRQRLPAIDSAGYYIAYMFGNIPSYLGGAVIPFLFPLVSERHEKGEPTGRLLLEVFAFVGVIGVAVVAFLAVSGEWILDLRAAWREYLAYAPYMWQIGIATTLTVILGCYNTHQLACRRFGHLLFYCPIVIAEVLLLYCLFGWSFFRGYLPASIWETVNAVAEQMDLQAVILFMIGARVLTMAAVSIDLLRPSTSARR